jgi:hypothetical protein
MKKAHHAPIDHRTMLRDVLGRYGLEDALQRKFAESDHLEERRERQRRKARHNEDLDGNDSEVNAAAATAASVSTSAYGRHVFSPSKLQDVYERNAPLVHNATPPRSTRNAAPWSPRACAVTAAPHDDHDATSSSAHKGSAAYRRGNFAQPDTPLPVAEVALRDGSLCVSSLARLQDYADKSTRTPADYAKVRSHAFDAQRRAALSRSIAEGDEIIQRLAVAATGDMSASPSRLLTTVPTSEEGHISSAAVRVVVPVMRSPKPVRIASPRVEHNSLDAFTPEDVSRYLVHRAEDRTRNQQYREAIALDATVLRTATGSPVETPLNHNDLPLPTGRHVHASSSAASSLACERLYQYGSTRNTIATSSTRPARMLTPTMMPSSSGLRTAKQHRDAAGATEWVVSSTFKCD